MWILRSTWKVGLPSSYLQPFSKINCNSHPPALYVHMFLPVVFFFFLIVIQLTYSIILVSGMQHNDLIYVVISDSLQPHGLRIRGLPVHYQLPKFTQTHIHWVGDAIQPYYPLSSPSPPTFNLSQHPGLFKWVSSSHQVPKVLEFHLQHQSFQWIFRTDFL